MKTLTSTRNSCAGNAKTYCQVLAKPAHSFLVDVRVFNCGMLRSFGIIYNFVYSYIPLSAVSSGIVFDISSLMSLIDIVVYFEVSCLKEILGTLNSNAVAEYTFTGIGI